MFSDRDYLIVFGIVFVAVFSFYISLRGDMQNAQAARPTEDAIVLAAKQAADAACGDIVEQCVALVETKLDECDKPAAKTKLERLLSGPLKMPACKNISEQMEQNCPKGCALDYSDLLIIPGEVKVGFMAPQDEFGQCLVRGSRPVSIRGRCVKAIG